MTRSFHFSRPAAVAGLAVVGALAMTGCGTETVCPPGPRATYDLLSLSSTSDLVTAQKLAPTATKEIADRASRSCALVRTGITTGGSISNLEIVPVKATVPSGTAAKRGPVLDQYQQRLETGLKAFPTQLDHLKATPGSPVFATVLRAIKEHGDAASGTPGPLVIALITDGIAIETTDLGRLLDLQAKTVDPDALRQTAGELRDALKQTHVHASVLIIGFGANSRLGDPQINRAQQLLEQTFKAAGIAVRFSRSDVPADPPATA